MLVSLAREKMRRHLPNGFAMRTPDDVGKITVEMAACAAIAIKVHANVRALPLNEGVRFFYADIQIKGFVQHGAPL